MLSDPENPTLMSETSATSKGQENKRPTQKMREIVEGTRERIASHLKYKRLKVKEYFGLLKPEEFDELISIDFQNHLEDNPPIEGTFSPEEELAEIRKMPKEQKREALTIFKKKLATQRDAWASCRTFIERSIEFNHDVPREKLSVLIRQFKENYGFTDKQTETAKEILRGYYYQRKRAIEAREQFPDNVDLVNHLTGMKFGKSEKFKISMGPMSVDISTSGFNAGRIYENSEEPVVGFRFGAFASESDDDFPVYYVVINSNLSVRLGYLDPLGQSSRRHEWEHQKNNLFRTLLGKKARADERRHLWQEYSGEQDPETKKTFLEGYLHLRQEEALIQAGDEITSMFQDRSSWTMQTDIGVLFSQNGGPYDYLGFLRNWKTDDPLWKEVSDKVLVKEYEDIVRKAVKSFTKLMKKGKYSKQDAIAVLTDKPLSNWPKTVKRQLEAKSK